jgi:secretion/DNA translocation related TadE-like protein
VTALGERGAASLVALGMVGVIFLLTMIVGDVGVYLRGRATAATAADAAALAAAPVTFAEFGAGGSPTEEAARFAAANGAILVTCECAIDRTWRTRSVHVVVTVAVELIMFGRRDVPASSRAEFDPTALPADS